MSPNRVNGSFKLNVGCTEPGTFVGTGTDAGAAKDIS